MADSPLGFQHQAGRLQLRIIDTRAIEPLFFLFRFAQTLSRSRSQQRRQAPRLAGGMGFASLLQGLRETPFKKQANGLVQRCGSPLAAAASTELADPVGQRKSQPDNAQEHVEQEEGGKEQKDGQSEGQLYAIGGHHQQQVAVAETRGQRDPNRHRSQCQ